MATFYDLSLRGCRLAHQTSPTRGDACLGERGGGGRKWGREDRWIWFNDNGKGGRTIFFLGIQRIFQRRWLDNRCISLLDVGFPARLCIDFSLPSLFMLFFFSEMFSSPYQPVGLFPVVMFLLIQGSFFPLYLWEIVCLFLACQNNRR